MKNLKKYSIYYLRTDIFINNTTNFTSKVGVYATIFIIIATILILFMESRNIGKLSSINHINMVIDPQLKSEWNEPTGEEAYIYHQDMPVKQHQLFPFVVYVFGLKIEDIKISFQIDGKNFISIGTP